MTMADVTVEVDWASDPGDPLSVATWTDVTAYVREGTISRGRQPEMSEFQPGTCRIALDNSDQRFDPDNTSSPYAPDVKMMKRVRVQATDPSDQTVYTLFVGYVEDYELGWRMPNDGHVTLDCVDAFGVLARKGLPVSVWDHEVSSLRPHWRWRFGEESGTTVLDSGVVGSDLTYVGSPTLGVTGLVEHDPNLAVNFDGAGGQVIGGPAGLGSVAGDYTVEFVINLDALTTDTSIWTFLCRIGGQFTCLINGFTGYLFVVDKDAGAKSTSAEFGLSVGQTAHIAVTVESGTTITIYANGVDESKAAVPAGSELKATANVSIGFDEFDGFAPNYTDLQGTIDEFAVYTEVLDAATIAAHAGAVSSAWNGDTSGERVGRVLDIIGWPSADRDIDTGQTTFGDADLGDDETVLQYLRRCERSEAGHLFIARTGDVRFIERHATITETVYNTSQATFDDTGAGLPYHDLRLDHGDRVYNEVTVQRKYGLDQTASDPSSRTSYLDRTLSERALLMDTDREARSAAQWILNRFRQPRTVVRSIELLPRSTDGLWAQVLGRDLMERVTVEFDPPGAGDTIAQESHIRGVTHRFSPERWETSWFLSPVDAVDYLILDDAVYGKLDTGALAY